MADLIFGILVFGIMLGMFGVICILLFVMARELL